MELFSTAAKLLVWHSRL